MAERMGVESRLRHASSGSRMEVGCVTSDTVAQAIGQQLQAPSLANFEASQHQGLRLCRRRAATLARAFRRRVVARPRHRARGRIS